MSQRDRRHYVLLRLMRIIRAILLTLVAGPLMSCVAVTQPWCEGGHFIGMKFLPTLGSPAVMHVGQVVTAAAVYGSGTGTQGENCDRTLYTSAEHPERFSYGSFDSTVIRVNKDIVSAIAVGATSVFANTAGTADTIVVTVLPAQTTRQ
jgi:hypothetical protein